MAEPAAIVLGEAPLMREAGIERCLGYRRAGEEALARRIQPKVTQVLHGRAVTVALETGLKRSHADAASPRDVLQPDTPRYIRADVSLGASHVPAGNRKLRVIGDRRQASALQKRGEQRLDASTNARLVVDRGDHGARRQHGVNLLEKRLHRRIPQLEARGAEE